MPASGLSMLCPDLALVPWQHGLVVLIKGIQLAPHLHNLRLTWPARPALSQGHTGRQLPVLLHPDLCSYCAASSGVVELGSWHLGAEGLCGCVCLLACLLACLRFWTEALGPCVLSLISIR